MELAQGKRASKEVWFKRVRRGAAAVAAIAVLAACNDSSDSAADTALATVPAATEGTAPQSADTPATEAIDSPATTAAEAGDPRAFACIDGENLYPGTFPECPIPNGGIDANGVPVFRYTNLSEPLEPIPYSADEPVYVDCRIPEEELPAQIASLNGGGLYILAGQYKGKAVSAANVYYNPTMPPDEEAFDPRVTLCGSAAIAAVTAPAGS